MGGLSDKLRDELVRQGKLDNLEELCQSCVLTSVFGGVDVWEVEECYCTVYGFILSSLFPLLVASLEQMQIKVVKRALSAGGEIMKVRPQFYYGVLGSLTMAGPAEDPYSDLTWKFHIYGNIGHS